MNDSTGMVRLTLAERPNARESGQRNSGSLNPGKPQPGKIPGHSPSVAGSFHAEEIAANGNFVALRAPL